MTVSILIPYTNPTGCAHRQAARSYILDHYATHHPDWQIVEGDSGTPWSKGAALASAASRAGGDVFLIADADSFTDPDVVADGVQRVVDTNGWVVPHRGVYRLDKQFTADVLAGSPPRPSRTCRAPYMGVAGGGITIVPRSVWDTVGGIDPRFEGWGGEDLAFGWALETLIGPCERLRAPLWHLWHPLEPKGRKRRGSPASEALAGRYRDALGHPEAMRALVDEAKEVLRGPDQADDDARHDHASHRG